MTNNSERLLNHLYKGKFSPENDTKLPAASSCKILKVRTQKKIFRPVFDEKSASEIDKTCDQIASKPRQTPLYAALSKWDSSVGLIIISYGIESME